MCVALAFLKLHTVGVFLLGRKGISMGTKVMRDIYENQMYTCQQECTAIPKVVPHTMHLW